VNKPITVCLLLIAFFSIGLYTSALAQDEPPTTQITVDGNPSDWESYEVLVTDSEGDHQGGGIDIAAISAFTNDQYLYLLIETHGNPTDYIVLDFYIMAGQRDLMVSASPAMGDPITMGENANGEWVDHGVIADAQIEIEESIEVKIPLATFGEFDFLDINFVPTGGECCDWQDMFPIDEADPFRVPELDQDEPPTTQITIDGNPSDWESYEVLVTDPEGDHLGGGFDIAAIRAFVNDQFLYILIDTYVTPEDYEVLDMDILLGDKEFIINSSPHNGNTMFMGEIVDDEWIDHGEVVGGSIAANEGIEVKLPLSLFGEKQSLELRIRPTGGVCCEWPDWYSIDEADMVVVPRLDEIEPEHVAVEGTKVPKICSDEIPSPIPFGLLETAPIDLMETGFSAEWFIAPGKIKMPYLTFVNPNGELFVYGRYDRKLFVVTSDDSTAVTQAKQKR